MKRPKISIIVPVYNVEKYLDRCIQSLLGQTLKEIEIILVDDGSTDKSPVLCDEYAKKDNRVKVIHKSNEGLGFARNSGMAVAMGEYIAFVDSDDFVSTQMYETLYEKVKDKRLDACFCGFAYYEDGNVRNKSEVNKIVLLKGRDEVDELLLDMVAPAPTYHSDVKYMMSVWKALYRKSLLDNFQIRFCSERQFVSEDLLFNMDFLQRASYIIFLPDVFYYYCVNRGTASLSHTYSRAKFIKNKVFLEEVKQRLSLLFPQDRFMNRYYRLSFLYLRVSLKQELKLCNKIRDKRHVIKELVGDPYFESMFNQYPYWKLPWKHKLLFAFLKHKCCNEILIFF